MGGSGDDGFHFQAATGTAINPFNPNQQIPVVTAGLVDAIEGGGGTNTLDFSGLAVPTDVSIEDQKELVTSPMASGVSGQYTGTLYNGLTQQTTNLVGVFYDISSFNGNAGSTLDTGATGFGKPLLFDPLLPNNGARPFTTTVAASAFDHVNCTSGGISRANSSCRRWARRSTRSRRSRSTAQ